MESVHRALFGARQDIGIGGWPSAPSAAKQNVEMSNSDLPGAAIDVEFDAGDVRGVL
jgi:hypothetical protein